MSDYPCADCEWTPTGFFAYPCMAHGCPSCGHLRHDSEDGCGHPDWITGWCECEVDSLTTPVSTTDALAVVAEEVEHHV